MAIQLQAGLGVEPSASIQILVIDVASVGVLGPFGTIAISSTIENRGLAEGSRVIADARPLTHQSRQSSFELAEEFVLGHHAH